MLLSKEQQKMIIKYNKVNSLIRNNPNSITGENFFLFNNKLYKVNMFTKTCISFPVQISIMNYKNPSKLPIKLSNNLIIPFINEDFAIDIREKEVCIYSPQKSFSEPLIFEKSVLPFIQAYSSLLDQPVHGSINLNQDTLKNLYKHEKFLADNSDCRKVFRYFLFTENTFWATTGHIGCEIDHNCTINLHEDETSILFPFHLLKENGIKINCLYQYIEYKKDNFIHLFKSEEITFIHKAHRPRELIYPDIKSAGFNKDTKKQYILSQAFNRKDLIEHIKSLPDNNRTHQIIFDIKNGLLVARPGDSIKYWKVPIYSNLTVYNVEDKDHLPLDYIAFNRIYLLQILNLLKDEKVFFNYTGQIKMMTISNINHYYLIMPLRVDYDIYYDQTKDIGKK